MGSEDLPGNVKAAASEHRPFDHGEERIPRRARACAHRTSRGALSLTLSAKGYSRIGVGFSFWTGARHPASKGGTPMEKEESPHARPEAPALPQ